MASWIRFNAHVQIWKPLSTFLVRIYDNDTRVRLATTCLPTSLQPPTRLTSIATLAYNRMDRRFPKCF